MNIRKEDALAYHSEGRKGKIEVVSSKPVNTLRDLSLAYSPGVAYPCLEIAADVSKVYEYTARGNVVAVISNGTAVLGLGNIGPEAAKPVMEGKAILFKKYADIDGMDIEVNVTDVEAFVQVVKALEPSFGGINLEDIKAPECFAIETRLRQEMKIPVMHDDQHGTAIISSAGLLNALTLVGKEISQVRMVISGAGASALACARMYIAFGLLKENLVLVDSKGPVTPGRTDLDAGKQELASAHPGIHSLADALQGADVFVGLSRANLVSQEMVKTMAPNPIIFALANPDPEIPYEEAMAARPDAILATGRSDYPNQVNNVLGFPYIFRGALDVRATTINEAMKMAASKAIAALAHEPVPDNISQIYAGRRLTFGRDYLIPKPMDPRLIVQVSMAVAKAAMESGVAQRPITDWNAYREELIQRIGANQSFMRSIMLKAQKDLQRIVFPEADNYKILKACQILIDENLAKPILLGKPENILRLLQEYEMELPGVEVINPEQEIGLRAQFAQRYFEQRMRKGVTINDAIRQMYHRNYFGMMMVNQGLADALVTGQNRNYPDYIRPALEIIGLENNISTACGLYILRSKKDIYFFADTTINREPTEDQLVDIATLVNRAVRHFGVEPRIAVLSYSNFGSNRDALTQRLANVVRRLKLKFPDVLLDGDVQANFALRPDLMQEFFPFNALAKAGANTFIFPNLAAANISYKLIQEIAEVESAGPILLGLQKPVYVLQTGSSVREIVNLSAVAALDALTRK